MRSDGADRITEVADRLFAAIEGGDVAAVARMWDDRDKERALRVIDWFISGTVERRYEVLDRQVFDDGFVQQHILLARGRTGASIALRVCLVVRIGADGLINRIDEYFDPAGIAPLLAAQDG